MKSIQTTPLFIALVISSTSAFSSEKDSSTHSLLTPITKGEVSLAELKERVKQDDILKFSASYSPWYINWKQTSTAAKRFGKNAINVNYQIDNALAHNVEFTVDAVGFVVSLDFISAQDNAVNNSLEQFNAVASTPHLLAGTYLEYRYHSTEFQGSISGSDNAGRKSVGTFNSKLTSSDVLLMTKYGVGLGLRNYDYDLPQDVYLVQSSQPKTIVSSSFADMNYSGQFYQLVYENSHLLNRPKNKLNIGINARYGIGTLSAKSPFISDIESYLNRRVISEANATIAEIDMFAKMNLFDGSKYVADVRLGYRSELIESSFDMLNSFSIVTDFETHFHGPYLRLDTRF